MTNTTEDFCGACGRGVTHTDCGGLLVAVAGQPVVPPIVYVLCLRCSAQLRSGDPMLKEEVMAAVERRLGPARGPRMNQDPTTGD